MAETFIVIDDRGRESAADIYHCVVLVSGSDPLAIFNTTEQADEFIALMDVRKTYPHVRQVRVPFWSAYWLRQLREGRVIAQRSPSKSVTR